MIGGTLIELTESDAGLFIEFRKYQDVFDMLMQTGVFDVKGGSVTIHFNAQGQIARVDKNETVFYRTAKD